MSLPGPTSYHYDYGLGIDDSCNHHIDYIKESHVVQSRVSPTRCYLLRPRSSGIEVGYDNLLTLTTSDFIDTSPNYIAQVWPSGSITHPSVNTESNSRQGDITLYIDSVEATRIMDVEDLIDDDEFVVKERIDREDKRIEFIFNEGFDPTAHILHWKYTAMNEGVSSELLKKGGSTNQSLYGWFQYTNNCYDNYQGRHQLLVRMPLVMRDLVLNEEGKVTLEEKESWMIWTPYVKDFDILVVSPTDSPTGEEMRFEIVNKRDSVIQRNLVSQRFKLKYIEPTDERYGVTIYTSDTTVDPLETSEDSDLWAPATEGETLWRYVASDLIYDPALEAYISTEQ